MNSLDGARSGLKKTGVLPKGSTTETKPFGSKPSTAPGGLKSTVKSSPFGASAATKSDPKPKPAVGGLKSTVKTSPFAASSTTAKSDPKPSPGKLNPNLTSAVKPIAPIVPGGPKPSPGKLNPNLKNTVILPGAKAPVTRKSVSGSPKKEKKDKVKAPDSPSKKKKLSVKADTSSTPIKKSPLRGTGGFGGTTPPSSATKQLPAKVFVCKESTGSLKVTKEMNAYVQRLQVTGVIPLIETTPRDNDLVAAMLHVASNDPCVGEIMVDSDPRFGHISSSAILDFGYGVRTNFYLTSLKIVNVELGNAFLSALAESIPTNWTLEYLDLTHNSFTSDALVEFALAMKENKSLLHVDLRHQHEAIHSQQEKAVLEALSENEYMQEFYVEFRAEKCDKFLETIISRNKSKGKKLTNREDKITEFLRAETETSEKEMEERDKEVAQASKELDDADCDYFYELANLAKKYKVDLSSTEDNKSSTPSIQNFTGGGTPSKGKALGKSLNIPAQNMTADGSFLNSEYIDAYLQEDPADKILTFEFTAQFKLFKRFASDDPSRKVIVEKFVEALVNHPRSEEFNVLNMANTCIADDFLQLFCERCLREDKLKNIHQLNLETNFIGGPGFIALAENIRNPKVWKYLTVVKADNQKSPVKTNAEVALAKALRVNRTVIRFSLRVRNLRERESINRCVQRNIDFLRQARQLYAKKTGTLVERKRNKMELLIDSIAANDPSVKGEVSIVGDLMFRALNKTEILKAAACFGNNTNVTSVKMSLINLDDEFAVELAKSIRTNKTIEKLDLDNNSIGSEGITAIISAMAVNKTITELQLRHQSKPVNSADEDALPDLMRPNETLMKLGVDLRSQLARNELDRIVRRNQETRRKTRAASRSRSPMRTPPTRSASQIKSVEVENLFKQVIANDPKVVEVALEKNAEFAQMPVSQKKEFLNGLAKNIYVKKLVLNHLDLDNGFADDLAATLVSNKKLETVSVNANQFTSPGVLAIAKAATNSKSVRNLSILKPRFNITNEDAEILVSAMEKKSNLQKLDIEFREESFTNRVNKVLQRNK